MGRLRVSGFEGVVVNVRAAVFRRRMEVVRLDLNGDVGGVPRIVGLVAMVSEPLEGVRGSRAISSSPALRERGWLVPGWTGVLGDGSFSRRDLILARVVGVVGLAKPGESKSNSISREGIESLESERSGDEAAMVLSLVRLHPSTSESWLVSITPSGGLCKMFHDFGLDVDSTCRKSSGLKLAPAISRHEVFRRIAKPREFCKEVMARSAAMDGGTVFGSWRLEESSFSEEEDGSRRGLGGAGRIGITTGLERVAAGATQSCLGLPCGVCSGLS